MDYSHTPATSRLIDGLNYWQYVTIFHHEWHVKKKQPKICQRIEAPLRWSREATGIRIVISEEWMTLNYNSGYWVDIPFAAAASHAAQNIALMMQAFKYDENSINLEGPNRPSRLRGCQAII